MMPNSALRKLFLAGILLASVGAARGLGGEPVEPFLEALRREKLYALAIDYLELLKGSAHLGPEVQQRLRYEQGETLLQSASGEADLAARGAQLQRAAQIFEEFRQEYPQHDLSCSAASRLASIMTERGRTETLLASQADDKEARLARARKYLDESRQRFDEAERELDARLQKLPKLVPPSEPQVQQQKHQLAADLAQARLLRAGVDYDLAATFAATSAEAKKHQRAAATSFAAVYESYRTRSVGLLARWWEGRCYQEMGQIKQALGCFRELADLPSSPETRVVKTKATRSALACWTHATQKKYQEAIECGERWEHEFAGSPTDADALAIRYLTAVAYNAQSKALPAKDPNRKKFVAFARQYVGPVAQQPGEYQSPAKVLLVALAGGKDRKDDGAQNATFAEAYEQGRQALERMQQASADLALARRGGDPAAIEVLEKQKRETVAAATTALRLALNRSDSKTPIEDLNSARYYLCFLAWDAGQYYDAAVLGEFLAERYPDSLPGRQGARIALAAWVRLSGEAKGTDGDFSKEHAQHVAQIIFKRWPDEEEADDAALTMLNFAVSERRYDQALDYLKKVSEKSPRRGQAELRAGQALWSAYLRILQAPAEERPNAQQLEQLKAQAREILGQGIARLEKADPIDATLAAAVLAMAQVCVETGQPDQAIAWLEKAKLGPLTLLKANHPAAAREGFATESYKIALRAYIAVKPQQLKKAEEVMDRLEQTVQKSSDEAASANLTAIYISLGRELEQHLQELRKAGKTKELEAVSQAFEMFLDRVTKRDAGASYGSLNWVGETYFGLGSGFDEGDGTFAKKAKEYFQKATVAYQRMLDVAQKDPKFKDQPDSLVGIRLRLADCYRRAGDFDTAVKTIVGILKDKPTRLNVQVQAAEMYQAHGAVDPSGYAMAINGASKGRDGKHVVWGWAKISQLTLNRPEFEETFHQARLNLAKARYLYSLTEKDEAKRKRVLEAAKQDLWVTYKLRPTLGGEKTVSEYEKLLKQIQKGLGAKETGLAEFKEREAAAPTT